MKNKKITLNEHLKFIILSLIVIFLFMLPVKVDDDFTILIAILYDLVQDLLSNALSAIMMVIIIISAVMSVIAKVGGEDSFKRTPFFKQLFHVSTFWTITRVLAAVFAVMVFFQLGPEAVYGEDT